MTIWKYPMPLCKHFSISMPHGAEVFTVQVQGGVPTAWAIVDTDAVKEPLHFRWVGTGQKLDENKSQYVGTIQDGDFVWHLFEVSA